MRPAGCPFCDVCGTRNGCRLSCEVKAYSSSLETAALVHKYARRNPLTSAPIGAYLLSVPSVYPSATESSSLVTAWWEVGPHVGGPVVCYPVAERPGWRWVVSLRAWTRLSALLAVLFLFSTPTLVIAQVAGTAALTGAVTDPSGAIVVGAEVTATNLATGAKRSATTDAAGKYQISQVPPGDYRVDVTATAFKTAVRPNPCRTTGMHRAPA